MSHFMALGPVANCTAARYRLNKSRMVPVLPQVLSQSLVGAIIFSTGKNATSGGGTGVDEAANLNGDPIFVSHVPAPSGAANGEFDDQFTWITVGELYGKLIAAGVLP